MKPTQKILLLVSFFALITSCEKETTKDAPIIPPQSSLIMDFSEFASAQDTMQKAGIDTMIAYHRNFGHAYFNVAIWNFYITVGMVIPVASFVEAFKHEAIYHPDEENWTWSYNFSANGTHEAELTGYFESDSIIWEMRIDSQLWYFGHSHTNGSGGYWIIHKPQDLTVRLLQIDWNKESEDVADLKYTNIEPGGTENGGYIFYGKNTDELNRFYDIYDKGQDRLIEIEWLSTDKHGRVKDFRKFGDYEWHCWDTTLVDISCE